MKAPTVNIEDSFPSLLVLASHNDSEGFKWLLDKKGASLINEVGAWYGRQNESKEIVLAHKTPLMVAATYGSIDVMKVILLYPDDVDVNFACAVNKCTALHCAASGGSVNAVDAVGLLILAGANVSSVDANGNRPVDVIVVPPKMQDLKLVLEELLSDNASGSDNRSVSVSVDSSSSALLCSPSVSPPSPAVDSKFTEKKEYPVDPSFPGIRNSIYTSDEFRMFSFKVLRCSRAHSHDWTDCPFVHPGENARRRDLRRFYHSCMPCPEFKKGACRYGDMCEFAHGVFECWLHPHLYRTRLCEDGTRCTRKVCFFAHSAKELRPSPRSSASALNMMNMAAALNLLVGSPSSVSSMSPSQFSSSAWAQQNVPTLHCPVSNFQSSQLRSSLSGREIRPEDFNVLSYLDGQQHLMNDLSCFSQPGPSSYRSKALTPSNLEELFTAEILSSARYSDPAMNQLKNMLSPSNTNMLSSKNVEHSLLQAASLGRMSPRSVEPISSRNPQMSAFAHREKQKHSSRDLGSNIPSSVVGSPKNSWSNLGSTNDCSVNGDELSRQMHSVSSFEHDIDGEEPDLSWVKVLVKDSSETIKGKFASSDGFNSNSQI